MIEESVRKVSNNGNERKAPNNENRRQVAEETSQIRRRKRKQQCGKQKNHDKATDCLMKWNNYH